MSTFDSFSHLGTLPFKGRNNALDRLFYDISSLSPEEQAELSPLKDREGTVLLVYPTGDGRKFDHFRNALQLVHNKPGDVGGIAIAGVGSSVLGTAALARNVADAIGAPVAGIVSGYGMTDLVAEALGGWFFFGAIDRGKYKAEAVMSTLSHGGTAGATTADGMGQGLRGTNALLDGLPLQSDTSALLDLLEVAPPNLKWLVGHSKGCLLIDYVLERYVRGQTKESDPLYDRLNVVTLGAVVNLPARFKNVTQVIGSIDGFGKLNSSLAVPHREIHGAWHHLNRALPAHLDAKEIIATIKAGESPGREEHVPGWRQPDLSLPVGLLP